MKPWLQTLRGEVYDYQQPDLSAIHLEDIAHSLSLINRFNGHTSRPISVAEHSLGVASMVREELELAALLHDAAEAFVGDMSAPLKRLCPDYCRIEAIAHQAIADRFGVPVELLEHPEIKQADLDALVTECEVLKGWQSKPWGVPGHYSAIYGMGLMGYEPPHYHKALWAESVRRLLEDRTSASPPEI